MKALHLYSARGNYTRREFVSRFSIFGLSGISLVNFSALAASCGGYSNQEARQESDEQQRAEKLGIALVGLGQYAEGQLAPALQETKHCYLAGIVSGSPEKVEKWKSKYDIPEKNIYNYENFDTIRDNPDIDIVYVVLPNALHAEYTVRAAKAAKHVICEKPMAITVEDCDRMMAACKEAGKMLSIGYRLHFEPYNKEMMRFGKDKVYGALQKIRTDNGMNGTGGWRLDKELAGGGPLMDMGIYCVQGARYTTGLEPIAVKAQEGAKKDPKMFKEVEESLSWQMEFPGNIIAECRTSYAESMSLLRAEGEKGWFELSPAYGYGGIKGKTSDGSMDFEQVNQQALQMDDFAIAIKEGRSTPVPGEMGRQDVKILQAIYEAMKTGRRIEIG